MPLASRGSTVNPGGRAEDVGAQGVAGNPELGLNSPCEFGAHGAAAVQPLPDKGRRGVNQAGECGLRTSLVYQRLQDMCAHSMTIASLPIIVNSTADRADKRHLIASLHA